MDSATLFPRLLLLDRDLKTLRDLLDDEQESTPSANPRPVSHRRSMRFRRTSAVSEPPPELQISAALQASAVRRPSFASDVPFLPSFATANVNSDISKDASTETATSSPSESVCRKAEELDWSPISTSSEKSNPHEEDRKEHDPSSLSPHRKGTHEPLKQRLKRMMGHGKGSTAGHG